MESFGKLCEGLASLAWPLILFYILYYFREQLKGVFTTLKQLEIGSAKLTFGEATEQLNKEIGDLRNEFLAYKNGIHNADKVCSTLSGSSSVQENLLEIDKLRCKQVESILWVDDNPNNNAFLVQELNASGVSVKIATSTVDGFKKFLNRRFDVVVSDMGRLEGVVYNHNAGIDLVKEIRNVDKDIPFVIYCSRRAELAKGEAAIEAGANLVVSSSTRLMGFIQQVGKVGLENNIPGDK